MSDGPILSPAQVQSAVAGLDARQATTGTWHRLAASHEALRARLAEAVELLRGLTERHPMSPAGAGARMAARVFIEEQGQ